MTHCVDFEVQNVNNPVHFLYDLLKNLQLVDPASCLVPSDQAPLASLNLSDNSVLRSDGTDLKTMVSYYLHDLHVSTDSPGFQGCLSLRCKARFLKFKKDSHLAPVASFAVPKAHFAITMAHFAITMAPFAITMARSAVPVAYPKAQKGDFAAPVADFAAPLAHFATLAHCAAPVAHSTIRVVHFAAPAAHFAPPEVHIAAPVVHCPPLMTAPSASNFAAPDTYGLVLVAH